MPSLRPETLDALVVSLKVALWATALDVVPGVGLAWLLARKRWRGKSVVETLVALPLVLPPVAVGYLLIVALGRNGFLGPETLGFDLDFILTWKGAVLASAVMALPLVVRTARVAIEAVDPRLESMGRSLGMSGAKVFFTITLPLARRGVVAALVLGFGRALGEFGATVVVAGNIPGETRTLAVAIFDSFQMGDEGGALQLVGVTALIAFALIFCVERLLARGRSAGEEPRVSWSGIEVRLRTRLADFELEMVFESTERAVGLFGPSGAGKTTVLEAIAGWRRVETGFVRVGERTLLDTARAVDVPVHARGIGYVPQDVLLFPHWSVLENIRAGDDRATRNGGDGALLDKVVEVLELATLLDRAPATLSGGEQRRVALARALCSRPDLLLLDEPLGALDVPLRRRILPYLVRVRESFALPLLYVTHDATEVHALCDHAVVVAAGRVKASGPPASVLAGPHLSASDLENVLRGEVTQCGEGTATLRVAEGVEFRIPRDELAPGDRALFGVRADDVLISTAPLAGLSARNFVPGRVESLVASGGDVHVQVRAGEDGGAPLLWASLTPEAARDLELEAGERVFLVVKTHSCRRLA